MRLKNGLLILGLCQAVFAYANKDFGQASHTEVCMRMIGHQILLQSGDEQSIVKPIEVLDNLYKIQFDAEFGFDPTAISRPIDSVLLAENISQHYIVEIVACDSQRVVHAYEVSENTDINACMGRVYPIGCYEVWVTLLDQSIFDMPVAKINEVSNAESDQEDYASLAFAMGAIAMVLAVSVFFLVRRKRVDHKNAHEIKLGAYIFNRNSMELLHENQIVELTGKEADLLKVLSDTPNDTIERDDILRKVWGDDGDYVGRTLDVFISKLRKKLEADSNVRIVNIRGIGYKLVLNS